MSGAGAALEVRALGDDERPWLEQQAIRLWGAPIVVGRGKVRRASELAAFVCEQGGEPVGLATWELQGADCELVMLNAFTNGAGIGTALLEAVAAEARRRGCRRLWLVTSNDNMRALRFYQRRGMRLVAVHRGALDEARRLKPEIPEVGDYGIPVRDELELELPLD